MLYTVYQVTHRESGKVYIGKHQTLNVADGYMGSGKWIKAAIKKHGVEAFSKEVLYVFETEAEMNAKEAELVTEEFCLREDTYNLCNGGNGGFSHINRSRSEIEYKRIGKLGGQAGTVKKAPHSRKTMLRLHFEGKLKHDSFGMLGKKHPDISKEKMSQSNKGSGNSQYGSVWINNGFESKKSKKDNIPIGWILGRKIKRDIS